MKLKQKRSRCLARYSWASVGEEPKTQYNQSEIEIKNGSRWYFYSDGIVDMENDKGRSWGKENADGYSKNSDLKFCLFSG